MESIFQRVKSIVTPKQATAQYGLNVQHGDWVCCPFHHDRHPSMKLYDEPHDWETRNICDIVNNGIANGDIVGWNAFKNPKRFGKYGTQRGWERKDAVNKTTATTVNQEKPEQLSFTVVENVPGHPWEEQAPVDASG